MNIHVAFMRQKCIAQYAIAFDRSVSWRNEESEPECMCPTMHSIKTSNIFFFFKFFIIFNGVHIKMNWISVGYYNGVGCSNGFGYTFDSYFVEWQLLEESWSAIESQQPTINSPLCNQIYE